MKTKITTKSKELNNLIEHSMKLSLIKVLFKKNEITEEEYFKLKEAIKKEHFSSKT